MLDDGAAEVILDTEEAAESLGNQTSDVSASGNESNPQEQHADEKDTDTTDLLGKIFSDVDASSDDILALASKEETVQMQAHIKSEIEILLFNAGLSSTTAAHAERIKSLVERNYYHWVRTFLTKKSMTEKTFAHSMRNGVFVSLIPPQTLTEGSLRNEASALCARMTTSTMPKFDEALMKQWTPTVEVFAMLDDNESNVSDIEESFVKFLESTYFATMKQCIEQHENTSGKFKPPVPIDHEATEETQALRKDMLARASDEDLVKISSIINASWNSFRANSPIDMQEKLFLNSPSQKFLDKHWYKTLAETVGQTQQASTRNMKEIPCTPSTLMITQCDVSQSQAQSSTGIATGMDFFLSGFAKVETSREPVQIDYMCAASILEAVPKTKCHFQGTLVNEVTEPRTIPKTTSPASSPQRRPRNGDGQYASEGGTPSKRKLGDGDETFALDLILADKTGPIIMTLWGEEAKTFTSKVQQSQRNHQVVIVDCKFVEVNVLPENSWTGRFVTQVRQLCSLQALGDRTASTIVCIASGSAPGMTTMNFKSPSSTFCMSQFVPLTAPCRGTFKGVVMDLGQIDHSTTGTEHKTFKLVDANGRFFKCQASYHNLQCGALQENQEVILFFALGRPPLKSKDGHLYMLRDSLIVPLGKKMLYGTPKQEMLISGEED
jgi:hypothetical protein